MGPESTSITNNGFLDTFALSIINHCNTAIDNLLPYVLGLMSVILMWNIITNWDLYWGKQDYTKLVPLVITATFFVALAYSWELVLNLIFQFGSDIGTTASGNPTYTLDGNFIKAVSPSTIINDGIRNVAVIFKGALLGKDTSEINTSTDILIASGKAISAVANPYDKSISIALFCGFITLLLFTIIAISYLYTVVEFFIIGSIAMVLLPFGLLDRTKAIVDKILNFFFISVIRLAIFIFLVTLIRPAIKNAFMNITWAEGALNAGLLYAMVSLFALSFLAFKTPSFASALFNGAVNSPPSLTGMGLQAVQTAIMLKTLGASKAAAATKKGSEKAVEEGIENSVKTGSESGSTAIDTTRKDVIKDSSNTSSNKGSTTATTTDNSASDKTSQTDTTNSNTDRTKKDTISDSGNMTDTSKKDHDVDTSTSNNTEAPVDSSRQVIDNYLDTSNGSIKDDNYSESNQNYTSHDSGSRINDMIRSESESISQQDSNQTTQKTNNHVKSTIQEFKIHELKSQEDKD
jgi:type IV secretory pathway TrbL component